jgi:hypothetical protein
MKILLKIEEAAMLLLAVWFILKVDFGYSWWIYTLVFLSPDIGIAGYALNSKVGALTYNLLHHRGTAIALIVFGLMTMNTVMLFLGLMFFAHGAFDRMLGFGLKYSDHFKHTHLDQ